ncbi:MAG: hypothetical protein WKF60_06480 [Ilumatobacter sp.]
MRHDTQLVLIDRINEHHATGRGTDCAEASYRVSAATYADADRLEAERRMLRSRRP